MKSEFYIKKIDEVLDALECENLFLKCISLFYLGVYVIDLYLLEKGFQVRNHGERKNFLRKVNKNLFSRWNSLFNISNDQRYNNITSETHLEKLKEDVLEILSLILIPEDLKKRIINTLSRF